MKLRKFVLIMLIISLFPSTPVRAQTDDPSATVQSILNSMTPEERVGQLFLVTYIGTDLSETSQIYDLLRNYHVGGVVLLAQNDNFSAAPDTVLRAFSEIKALQRLNWDLSTNPPPDLVSGEVQRSTYVPLFVGIAQEGNGPPTDQILDGLTPLPSEMAIGAT